MASDRPKVARQAKSRTGLRRPLRAPSPDPREAPSRIHAKGRVRPESGNPAPARTQTEQADDRQTRRQEQCNQQRELLAASEAE